MIFVVDGFVTVVRIFGKRPSVDCAISHLSHIHVSNQTIVTNNICNVFVLYDFFYWMVELST